MLLASLPIDVVMRRSRPSHWWASEGWVAAAVLPAGTDISPHKVDPPDESRTRLMLELHPDENDGYFENWAAPQPKVFVSWQLQGEGAVPVLASVSYGEGTRMLDSGDPSDGVPMPAEVHAWLAVYLRIHYRPRQWLYGHGTRLARNPP
ncbi:MAG: hypothetical protein JWR60_3236 [Polaromonas sp.]|nr:hypothetical protein [Polaromonas sp.]